MTAIASVRYEGSTVDLDSSKDTDGDRFDFVEPEGLDGMETELELIDRHGTGSTFGMGRYPRRELLVKGRAIGNRTEDGSIFRAMRKVESWFADFSWQERWLYFDLESPGESVQLKVVPGGKLTMGTPQGNICDFEVPFTAMDPRKYSQTLRTEEVDSSTKTLTNGGNFPTYLNAELLQDASSCWIEIENDHGTHRLTLDTTDGDVPEGVLVDFLERRTIHPVDGIVDMALIPRPWVPLLPGNNTVRTNGKWGFAWRDAWR